MMVAGPIVIAGYFSCFQNDQNMCEVEIIPRNQLMLHILSNVPKYVGTDWNRVGTPGIDAVLAPFWLIMQCLQGYHNDCVLKSAKNMYLYALFLWDHYNDVIMNAMASQITSLTIFFTQPFIQVHIDCLLRRRSKKENIKHHVTGLCAGNSPVTGKFPAEWANNAKNVSIWWRHHDPVTWWNLIFTTSQRFSLFINGLQMYRA